MSVVIANGFGLKSILNVVNGKTLGTFFTPAPATATPVEVQASEGRVGEGRQLGGLLLHVGFKKWQCPTSLFCDFHVDLKKILMSHVDFEKCRVTYSCPHVTMLYVACRF